MSNLFEPKKVKFRKCHKGNKGKINGIAPAREFSSLQGGNYVICMKSNIRLESKHFTVVRMLCSKAIKSEKKGTFRISQFPNRGLTKKAAETRMGSGKGAPEKFVAMAKAGSVLIEFFDVPLSTIIQINSQITCKVPGGTELLLNGNECSYKGENHEK